MSINTFSGLIIVLAGFLVSIATNATERAPSAIAADLKRAIIADANEGGFIHTLARPITLYHWFNNTPGPAGWPAPDDASWETHAKLRAASFYKYGQSNSVLGDGLYLATDPNSSASYGDVLLEINVPSGTKFWDLRYSSFFFSQATINLFEDLCPGQRLRNFEGDFSYNIHGKVYHSLLKEEIYRNQNFGPNSGLCIKTFNEAFRQLGVTLLAYKWAGSRSELFPPCTTNDITAFVAIGTIDSAAELTAPTVSFNTGSNRQSRWTFHGYVRAGDLPANSSQRAIDMAIKVDQLKRRFRTEQITPGGIYRFFDPDGVNPLNTPRPSAQLKTNIESILNSFMYDSIFGCRNDLYPEDVMVPAQEIRN